MIRNVAFVEMYSTSMREILPLVHSLPRELAAAARSIFKSGSSGPTAAEEGWSGKNNNVDATRAQTILAFMQIHCLACGDLNCVNI